MILLKGDIVCKHGSGLLSLGIETITHSTVSHVALVADPEKELLIEAEGFRVIGYKSLEEYKGSCTIIRVPTLTDEQRNDIVAYAHQQFGKQYDYFDIFKQLERYVFGYAPDPEDGRLFICSTLIDMAYKSVGVTLTDQPLASPDDVFKTKLGVVMGQY